MRKTVMAAAAAFAVASGAIIGQAAAADLDYMPAPAPAPIIPTWQGFYIGGHVGYGEADFDANASALFWEDPNSNFILDEGEESIFESFRSSLTADGIIGGAQAGYNFQAGSLVFGIEGDISFADWDRSSIVFDEDFDDYDNFVPDAEGRAIGAASVDVDMLASVRGRLGYAFDSVMIYGTGGVAWADASARGTIDVYDGDGEFVETLSSKKDFDDIGFVVGGGLGWMVIPQTFSVGVEGLWYFFDEKKTWVDETYELAEDEYVDLHASASLDDAWVIRARADFHF